MKILLLHIPQDKAYCLLNFNTNQRSIWTKSLHEVFYKFSPVDNVDLYYERVKRFQGEIIEYNFNSVEELRDYFIEELI